MNMPNIQRLLMLIFILVPLFAMSKSAGDDVKHGFVDSGEIKIHYATAGEGPLVILIHGFPDYWYTWRKQIPLLAKHFKVVAIDQRGYNKSDQPQGVDSYAMKNLVGDIIAVADHFDAKRVTLVGHDWGAAVAWNVAFSHSKRVERLVIMSVPHPSGLTRELSGNEDQKSNSQYALDFQKDGAAKMFTPNRLAGWVKDKDSREKYVEAFERSSIEGMLNYYKANYPRKSADESSALPKATPRRVKCPVLVFHGLKDKYLLAAGFNNNWDWIEQDSTFIMIPSAGHFVHHDATELVNRRLMSWLTE